MNQLLEPRYYTAWQLVKLYWKSEYYKTAYLLLGLTTILTLVMVGFDVVFSYWMNYFYDALQGYKGRETVILLFVFCGLAACYIVVAVYRYYLSQMLGLRWRRWLTEQIVGRWLEKRDYYYMETFDKRTDNPDQRIQEDVGALVTSTISLVLGFISAVTTFIAFIYVLWTLSGVITLPLGRFGTWHIPGYLVWVSVIYSLVGTYITFRIGYPLIGLNFEQQRREATFRYAAIDLRSHAEHIALYDGEDYQKGILHRLFNRVLHNWYLIILRQKLLLYFTNGFNQIAVILPLMVALPNYFSKVFLLGGVMQSIRAFNNLQEASSFFVNSYPQIAEWRAVARRLTTFLDHLQEIDERVNQQKKLTINTQLENKITAQDVSISMPTGEILLKGVNEEFVHGQNYLIKGESGIGKSTFVRAMAGIWPYADGAFALPENKRVMFLPQKPYMPMGTLAQAIVFPDHDHQSMKPQLEQALRECNLENLIGRLHETAHWGEQLSPGEQQRIAFARVLLQKPDWVIMDESTSFLDIGNEEQMYKLMKTKMPNCSIISVGHRPTLEAYHDHVIKMENYSAQPQRLAV